MPSKITQAADIERAVMITSDLGSEGLDLNCCEFASLKDNRHPVIRVVNTWGN